jgi:hypothetical protein
VHEYHERTAADVPVDGRRVLVRVRVRRMRCPALDCQVQTFREQVPGVLDRYQRRISRLTAQVSKVACELAGRASARLLPALGIMVSRHTALRVLLKIPLAEVTVPRVLGLDLSRFCDYPDCWRAAAADAVVAGCVRGGPGVGQVGIIPPV